VAWIVVGIVLTYVYESLPPILFLLGSAFFGGIAMAIYTPLALVLNRTRLPAELRPGPVRCALLGVISAFYIVFALVSVVVLVQHLLV